MKRLICSVLLLFAFASTLPADTLQDLQGYLDLHTSLENMANALEDPQYDPAADGRLKLINGTIASITIIDDSKESFEVIVEIAVGQWTDKETIQLVRGYFAFFDPQHAPYFGISDQAGTYRQLEIGDQLLLIAQPLGTIMDPVDESEALFFEVQFFRLIK